MSSRIVICHNTGNTLFLHYEQLIRVLVERGDEVICVTPEDEAAPKILALGASHRAWAVSQHGLHPLQELYSWRCLSKLVGELSPDIFLSITIKPVVYGSLVRLSTAKRFFMFSGLGYVFIGNAIKQKILRYLVNSLLKRSLRKANAVFFQNQDDADEFVANRILARKQAVAVNGTGINTDDFLEKKYKPDSRAVLNFLFVGRILRDKGVYEFVAAAKEILAKNDQAVFSLLGPLDKNPSAIQRKELERWERAGTIRYLGVTTDVKKYLLDADVFVLPSYREGLSRATLEAMSMGLPIITTDVPGCRQTVEQGVNGYLVPREDASALASAMNQFINDRSLIPIMGALARKKAVKVFDIHQVVSSIITHLDER